MSDERNEHFEAERSEAPPEPVPGEETTPWKAPPNPLDPPAYQRRPRSWAPLWLAALLIVIIAGVLSSPFWAGVVRPLLPWGEQSSAGRYDALAQRVAALEARPVASPVDADAIKSAQAPLAQKIAALEDRVAALRQTPEETAPTKAALTQQSQRLDALQAQAAAHGAAQAAMIERIQQELSQRGAVSGELAARLDALEHQVHTQSNAERGEGVRLLALLQMREAVEAGQPFPAEYAAFSQLAAHDPELAAAARPLADAARDGVANLAELRRRLAAVADRNASAKAPPASTSWWDAALAQVRALVTVRRVDGAAKSGPEATVDAAQNALAQGDLTGSIKALDELSGADAAAAQPWLKLARQRLAAEAALMHLQGLLTAQLGGAAVAPAATAPPPAPATASPPAAPKAPS